MIFDEKTQTKKRARMHTHIFHHNKADKDGVGSKRGAEEKEDGT